MERNRLHSHPALRIGNGCMQAKAFGTGALVSGRVAKCHTSTDFHIPNAQLMAKQ
jgi:hypothetical protein